MMKMKINVFTQFSTADGATTSTVNSNASHYLNIRYWNEKNGRTIGSGNEADMKKMFDETYFWLTTVDGFKRAKNTIPRDDWFAATNDATNDALECWIATKPITHPG